MQITGTDVRNDLNYNIGFIGASKAGTAFANYLLDSGISVAGFCSYNFDSAITSAQITRTKAYAKLSDLLIDVNIIIISVADSFIDSIWQQIKQFDLSNKTVLHLSGFLSSDIFVDYKKYCLGVASLHIPISFAFKDTTPKELKTSCFVVEGNQFALKAITQIASQTNNKLIKIKTTHKAKYHAACVLSSSLILAQLKNANEIIKDTLYLSEQSNEIERLVLNLATSAMNNAKKSNDLISAITGPIARNDSVVISEHLKSLKNTQSEILYKILSNMLLENIQLENKQNLQDILK